MKENPLSIDNEKLEKYNLYERISPKTKDKKVVLTKLSCKHKIIRFKILREIISEITSISVSKEAEYK